MLIDRMMSLACFSIESHVNRALTKDATLTQLIQPLSEKTLHVIIEDIPQDIFINFYAHRIAITFDVPNSEIATTLRAPTPIYFKMLNAVRRKEGIDYQGLVVEGRTSFLQQVVEFFQYATPEFEAILADWIGDVPARSVFIPIKKMLNFKKNVVHSFKQNLTEYIQEEKKWSPSPSAVSAFTDRLHQARLQLDRIEARLSSLEKNAYETD